MPDMSKLRSGCLSGWWGLRTLSDGALRSKNSLAREAEKARFNSSYSYAAFRYFIAWSSSIIMALLLLLLP